MTHFLTATHLLGTTGLNDWHCKVPVRQWHGQGVAGSGPLAPLTKQKKLNITGGFCVVFFNLNKLVPSFVPYNEYTPLNQSCFVF